VFIFNKDALAASEDSLAQASPPPASVPQQSPASSSLMQQAITWEKTEVAKTDSKEGENPAQGKAPESYFARATFSTEDVENIKIVTEGVFCVDINALSKNPVVLKDEEGVYYVKIPFGQDKWDEEKGGDNREAQEKEGPGSGKNGKK